MITKAQRKAAQDEAILRAKLGPVGFQLLEALEAASTHLDYCGYGDKWERECAEELGLEEKISAAIVAARKV